MTGDRQRGRWSRRDCEHSRHGVVSMRRSHSAGITLACAIGLAATARAQSARPQPGERYALLVGVRQYDSNEGLRNLRYSEADVVELAGVLKGAGYRQVVALTQTA